MAHVEKFRAAGCGHMFKHYERAKEFNKETGEYEYVRFKNQEIDKTRTHLNYNLAPKKYDEKGKEMSQLEIMHRRLKAEDVYFRKRKDTNVMCSCIVTKPKDLPAEESDRFFKRAYDALAKRYGEENIISAYVHKDETEDHMHFSFVPVAFDIKKQRFTVSAKMKISKTDLQGLHPYLTKEMIDEFGYDVGIQNGATKNGNLTTDQLKTQTKRAEALAKENERLQKENEALKNKNIGLQESNVMLEYDIREKREVIKQVEEACSIKSEEELEQVKAAAVSEISQLSHVFDDVDYLAEELEEEMKIPVAEHVNSLVKELLFCWKKCSERFFQLVSDIREKIVNIALFEKIKNIPENLRSADSLANKLKAAGETFEKRSQNLANFQKNTDEKDTL